MRPPKPGLTWPSLPSLWARAAVGRSGSPASLPASCWSWWTLQTALLCSSAAALPLVQQALRPSHGAPARPHHLTAPSTTLITFTTPSFPSHPAPSTRHASSKSQTPPLLVNRYRALRISGTAYCLYHTHRPRAPPSYPLSSCCYIQATACHIHSHPVCTDRPRRRSTLLSVVLIVKPIQALSVLRRSN